jgi:type II secretory pathway component GspD/PulD (secretin)
MRIVATALGLCVAVTAACSSSGKRSEPMPEPEAGEPQAAQEQEPVSSGDYASQQAELLSLAEQKKRFLVENHLQRASEQKERMELEAAEQELARALQLDPDNLEAKSMLAEVGALLGRAPGETQTTIQELENKARLKKDQLEIDARQKVDKAKLALSRGDYDGALVELTLAQDQIRWSPYSGNWQPLEQEIEGLITQARSQKQTAEQANLAAAQKEARESLRTQEQAEQERRSQVISNLLGQAITAFETEEYDKTIELADRVLRLDPRNERALDLRDTAFRKGRDLVQDDFLRNKLVQYQRWQEDLDELRIPYQGVITLPDEDQWRAITALRASRTNLELGAADSPVALELRAQLTSTRIPGLSVKDEESLTAVIQALNAITGIPMITDPAAEQAAVDAGVVFNIELTNTIAVDKVLNLVSQNAGENVTWTVRHDTVLVTTREKARGELLIFNHDVQDLIFGLTDFLGPRIDRLRLLDDLEDDDENSGGAFGKIGEKPAINAPEDLATLVQENVAVGTWEDEGVAITVEGGNMIVVHSAAVQQQVRQFLEELRRFSASLVTIESKFLVIGDHFLQDIGVDFRGLDNPGTPFTDLDDVNLDGSPSLGLDNSGDGVTLTPPSAGAFYDEGGDGDVKGRTENIFDGVLGNALSTIGGMTVQYTFLNDLQLSAIMRLVEKSENIELINDQVLSVHNTQRAYVTVVNQRAYVQDFDVEVAQFQAVADPQINVLTEGIVLDVRPTIHHDRRYLTLEIQPTVAQVVALTDFSTTLAGQTAAVTFQLPELQVQSVFTTAVVPDGGSILIGGLSRLRNIERRSEVPWIANVPLLGFFFKEDGYSDERESLMILIRAWITDVKEELARLEGR